MEDARQRMTEKEALAFQKMAVILGSDNHSLFLDPTVSDTAGGGAQDTFSPHVELDTGFASGLDQEWSLFSSHM
jgi:hypothetical protein